MFTRILDPDNIEKRHNIEINFQTLIWHLFQQYGLEPIFVSVISRNSYDTVMIVENFFVNVGLNNSKILFQLEYDFTINEISKLEADMYVEDFEHITWKLNTFVDFIIAFISKGTLKELLLQHKKIIQNI